MLGAALGAKGGGLGGAILGALGGLGLGVPTGPGALLTAGAGAVGGAEAGSASGAIVGAAIGGVVGAAVDVMYLKGESAEIGKAIEAVKGRRFNTEPNRRGVGDYCEDCKANGLRGTKNAKGDFTWEELKQRVREFFEGQ